MIELEQRYNTYCNIDTSPFLVEEMAQQEWNPFSDINFMTSLYRYWIHGNKKMRK